jgi:hypothetical protein
MAENFNTRRNKKGAGTVASEGRMGSNKSSFGMHRSFIPFDCIVYSAIDYSVYKKCT